MSGAYSLMNVLADVLGPGTVGLHGEPQVTVCCIKTCYFCFKWLFVWFIITIYFFLPSLLLGNCVINSNISVLYLKYCLFSFFFIKRVVTLCMILILILEFLPCIWSYDSLYDFASCNLECYYLLFSW